MTFSPVSTIRNRHTLKTHSSPRNALGRVFLSNNFSSGFRCANNHTRYIVSALVSRHMRVWLCELFNLRYLVGLIESTNICPVKWKSIDRSPSLAVLLLCCCLSLASRGHCESVCKCLYASALQELLSKS